MAKVDLKKMEQMLRSGMKNKDVAEYFGVTPGCISQHSKNIKNLVVRSVALEKAHEVVSSHLDVVGQLQRINDSINHELQKAQEEADKTDGSARIAFQKIIIELSAEVRRQLDSQVKIFELWHDTRVIHEFHEEILQILEEVKPGLRDEIIHRLQQKRVVRSTVKFS
jgi:hypothetical protein